MASEIANTVDVDGTATNYHDRGSGEPVLLLHGSGPGVSAWANWRLTLPALARRFRVLAPDIVGFGYTERPPGTDYNLETWLAHVTGFLDAVGLERVAVVGNSFGGGLALHLATRYPERVDRLVLMGSVGVSFPLTEGLDAVWGYEPSVEAMRGLLDLFVFNRDLVDDDLAALRYEASTRPGVQEAYAHMFPAPRQSSIEALAVDEDELARLEHETLIVHGREDAIVPPATSQRLFALVPASQLHLFGRCGHWVQVEHADRFNRLVGGFLEEGVASSADE